MLPLLSSRPRASRKHTGASTVGDIHSDALYLLLPQFTPQLSSSIPWAHLPLPTPPSWLPIPKAWHHDASASVVVPKYPIPWTHCLFLVLCQRLRRRRKFRGPVSEGLLIFGLLTSYLLWWRFSPVTFGRGCLPNLVGDGTIEKF